MWLIDIIFIPLSQRIKHSSYHSRVIMLINIQMLCNTIQALILSKKLFGDGHIMLSVLSREKGFLKISAFGGQRLSKRFKGKLDYFQVLEMEVRQSVKDGLVYYNLCATDKVLKVFNTIPKDIKKYFAASYVLELPGIILTEAEDYFDLVYHYLEKIDGLKDISFLNRVVIEYTLKIYRKAGFICNNLDIADNKLAFRELYSLHSGLLNRIPKTHAMLESLF
jgi:recombinational DNA repair protein (RecF pathway)